MSKQHILFNSKANNGKGKAAAEAAAALLGGECSIEDITEIKDIREYLNNADPDDKIVLCGGDGTINHLANDLGGQAPGHTVLYYPAGTGNDFLRDVAGENSRELVTLDPYIVDLPTVEVKGRRRLFLNNVGFGIDGYACEVGDEHRAKSDKPVNYTSIVIKGLLFHFKPANAEVTVDGKKYTFKKVWLAPSMNGRCYGGGMMIAPAQDRLAEDRALSLVVVHDSGKLKILSIFPSIFKGEHVSHTDIVTIIKGHDITVKFDRPCALQIDGETVKGVTEYHVTR